MSPPESSLSHLVYQQLRELRIDPDGVSTAGRPALTRVLRRIGRHTHAVVLTGVGAALLCILLATVVISLNLMNQSGANSRGEQPVQSSVSLGGFTLQIGAPAYHPYGMGQGGLTLHMDLSNSSGTQGELSASDLLLVDARGALFPPSWHSLDGKSVDGLADPGHVFVSLAPNAAAAFDLQFLVLGPGPFTLRYQHLGQHVDTPLPPLTLTSQP